MRHFLLRHHLQKKILFRTNMYRKDIERTYLNKLTKLISSDMEKKFSNFFSDVSNSSYIEEEIIKQINTLKPLDMEPCKVIPKKPFVLEEENNCEEEINLTPQDKIGNIDGCKCVCEC